MGVNFMKIRALFSSVKKLGHWMGGWMDGKAGLRIAYSNQKLLVVIQQCNLNS